MSHSVQMRENVTSKSEMADELNLSFAPSPSVDAATAISTYYDWIPYAVLIPFENGVETCESGLPEAALRFDTIDARPNADESCLN